MIVQRVDAKGYNKTVSYCFRILINDALYLNDNRVSDYDSFEEVLQYVTIITQEEL